MPEIGDSEYGEIPNFIELLAENVPDRKSVTTLTKITWGVHTKLEVKGEMLSIKCFLDAIDK